MKKKYIRLSELLAKGVKYIRPDYHTIIVFGDDTVISAHWNDSQSDAGTDFSDIEFCCWKGKEFFNVIDDIGFKLPKIPDGLQHRSKHCVWTNASSEEDIENFKKLGYL